MTIKIERARELLAAFPNQRVLVVGDLMWDRYIYGAVHRISPEAPVPIVEVTREHQMPGGASNVVWNVRSLGGQAVACGVVGKDGAGAELQAFFKREGIDEAGLVVAPGGRTTVKTRVIAESQQVVRVDWDADAEMSKDLLETLVRVATEQIAGATGVIIEDYGKGVVQQALVDVVVEAAQRQGIPTALDPKDNRNLSVAGMTVATPNRTEAYHAVGREFGRAAAEPMADRTLLEVGRDLLAHWKLDHLLITLGSQGMMLFRPAMEPRHVPTRAREVFDVSGAGDTVIAAYLLALSAGADAEEAAELANHASGVVVGHIGTACCTAPEVLESIEGHADA